MTPHKHHSLPLENTAGQFQETLPRLQTAIMPETALPNLIRMIRLLDGELSAADAKPLRRLIADDVKLAEQYQHLTRVLTRPMSPEELLQHAGQIDSAKVAGFIECSMAESEQAAFERRCWASASLLREVVSTWRAAQMAELAAGEPVSDERVQSVVSALLAPATTAAQAKVESRSDPDTKTDSDLPTETDSLEPGQNSKPAGLPEIVMPEIVMTEKPRASRPTRRSSGLVLLTTGLVLAFVVVAVQFFWRPWEDQRADREEPRPTGNPDEINSPQIARDDGDPREPPEKAPVISDEPDPDRRPGTGPIVQKDPRTPPTIPENPDPKPGIEVRTLVEWSDVRGIAGVRDSESAAWSGILSEQAADLWKSNARTQLLTLAQSRVTGKAANGSRLIVAADSVVEISERSVGSRSAPAEKAAPITCQVQSGRLAVTGLAEGQRVVVLIEGNAFEIQATRDDSVIAIEREAQKTILASYRGGATVDGEELTRRRWASIGSSGELTVLRPQRVADWYRDSVAKGLPTSLCDDFNQAGNLVQMAASVRQSPDPVIGFVATQVALQCSTSGSDPLSLNLARQISGSGNEAHRLALVQWLVARVRQNPSVGDADLKLLFRLQQVDRQTATKMTGWFQAAAEGRRPTVMQLTELTTGLRDPAPLFTKQCAKFFLQQILGDPLAEYNPRAPANRTALSSVSRKVRAWQQANLK